MADLTDSLVRMSEPPLNTEAFKSWLEMGSAFDFLRDNTRQNDFVVYASDSSSFIHAILAPALLNPPDIDDLMSWSAPQHPLGESRCDSLSRAQFGYRRRWITRGARPLTKASSWCFRATLTAASARRVTPRFCRSSRICSASTTWTSAMRT